MRHIISKNLIRLKSALLYFAGPNGLNYNGPICEEAGFCTFVPNSKDNCKTDETWPGSCPCTCQD